MKNISFLVSFILISMSLFAQESVLVPSKNNNVWGAIDLEHNEVIPFSYNMVSFYSNGYYLVENNGKKGLYNSLGKQILQGVYDAIKPIGENRFQVFQNYKTGVVGLFDKVIIPIEFNTIISKKGKKDFIVVQGGKYAIFNSVGYNLTPFHFDNISFYGEKYFLYKKDGQFAVHKGAALLSDLEFYDDVVRQGKFFLVRDGSSWGTLDSNCELIIKVKNDAISLYGNDQFFKVKNNEGYAFFDLNGKRLTRYKFSNPVYYFDNNVLWYKVDDWFRYDFVTKKNKPLSITRIIDVVKGYTRVVNNNFVELVDSGESTLFGGKYHDVIPLNSNLFKVQYMRKWGVVDIHGDQVINISYDRIHLNTIEVKSEISYDLFDDEHINEHRNIYPELFTISNNEKVGVYSAKGVEIVPIAFDELEVSVNNLMIRTKSKGRYNVYNRQGLRLFDENYKSIDWSENQKYFTLYTDTTIAVSDTLGMITNLENVSSVKWSLKKGMFFDKQDGYYGLRNISSDTIIGYKYKNIYDLDEDYFVGVVDSGVYLFDANGEKLISNKIKSIEVVNKEEKLCFIVLKDDGFGVLNNKGEIIIPFEYSRITFDKGHNLFRVEKKSKIVGYISLDGNKYF